MKRSWLAFSLVTAASAALAADSPTALDAIKLLPPGKAARIAWIEGRDGDPEPRRWYLVVQDEFDENGVHEYVVSGHEIVASRSVSQFVASLTPDDIVGGDSIKIDSSGARRIANAYAAANSLKFTRLNYRLKREGEAPLWKVTCLDDAGALVGEVTLDASKGTVLSHQGFITSPTPDIPKSASARKRKKPARDGPAPIAAPPDGAPPPNSDPANQAGAGGTRDPNSGLFQRIGGSISHIFNGH